MRRAALIAATVLLLAGPCLAAQAGTRADAPATGLTVCGRPVAFASRAARRQADGTIYVRLDALPAATGLDVEDSGRVVSWFGSTLCFRTGTTRFSCGPGDQRDCAAAPVSEGGAVWVPAAMLSSSFGWTAKPQGDGVALWAPGAQVTSVRQGHHPDRTRMVVDLSGPTFYQVRREEGQISLLLPPADGTDSTAGQLRLLEFSGDVVPRAGEEVQTDGWTKLTFAYSGVKRVDVFTLSSPARIVLDFMLEHPATPPPPTAADTTGPAPLTGTAPAGAKAPASQPPTSAALSQAPAQASSSTSSLPTPSLPDGTWQSIMWPTGAGATMVHLLAFDPAKGNYELRPALAGDVVTQRASVAKIANACGAVAAVNGGFFAPHLGVPLGMLVIDGEWIRPPIPERPVFAVLGDGRCVIGRVHMDGRAVFKGMGYLPVCGLNQNETEPNGIVAFTHRFGPTVPGVMGRTRLIVSERGRVIFKETSGADVQIPPGGMVLSGSGKRADTLKEVPLGTEVKVTFTARPDWPNLRHAIGGGPLLVADGCLALDPKREGFHGDVASGRHARTALGILADGRVVLVCAEGGAGGRGPGLTLTEEANLMLHIGCRSAMNLDGGGSTTLVVRGEVVNNCADGFPRAVSNALVLVPRQQKGKG